VVVFTLTSDATKGANIPAILAAAEETPNPLVRTSVGNNSLVYKKSIANAVETPNFPVNDRIMVVPTRLSAISKEQYIDNIKQVIML